jgi:hypothetical protein
MKKVLITVACLLLGACAAAPSPEAREPGRVQVAAAVPGARGDKQEAKPAAPAAAEAAESAPESGPLAIPTACAGDAKPCAPPRDFVKKLCAGRYPEVALTMFSGSSPWTRLYLAGDVDAWNASGGLAHRAKIAFDEEVLVLAKRDPGAGGGIVMTGMQASYDVLRWDGTCVSLMEGEITAKKPPAPKPAPLSFSRLEEPTRQALLAAPKVKAALDAIGKECGSVSTPQAKKRCDKADKAFTAAITSYVRGGGALPTPGRRP